MTAWDDFKNATWGDIGSAIKDGAEDLAKGAVNVADNGAKIAGSSLANGAGLIGNLAKDTVKDITTGNLGDIESDAGQDFENFKDNALDTGHDLADDGQINNSVQKTNQTDNLQKQMQGALDIGNESNTEADKQLAQDYQGLTGSTLTSGQQTAMNNNLEKGTKGLENQQENQEINDATNTAKNIVNTAAETGSLIKRTSK